MATKKSATQSMKESVSKAYKEAVKSTPKKLGADAMPKKKAKK